MRTSLSRRTSIVDEYVDCAKRLDCILHDLVDLVLLRHVMSIGNRNPAISRDLFHD